MKKVLKFSASWCAPCRAIAPMFKELKEEFKSKIEFEDIDVDTEPTLTQKYNITSVPTIIFLNEEDITDMHKGALTKTAMKNKLETLLEI